MVRVGEKRYLNTLDTNIRRYYLEILFEDIIWNTFKGKPLVELPRLCYDLVPRELLRGMKLYFQHLTTHIYYLKLH